MAKASSTLRAGEPVEINVLREVDVSAALQLEDREEWNQTEDDWKRILGLIRMVVSPHFAPGN